MTRKHAVAKKKDTQMRPSVDLTLHYLRPSFCISNNILKSVSRLGNNFTTSLCTAFSFPEEPCYLTIFMHKKKYEIRKKKAVFSYILLKKKHSNSRAFLILHLHHRNKSYFLTTASKGQAKVRSCLPQQQTAHLVQTNKMGKAKNTVFLSLRPWSAVPAYKYKQETEVCRI